MILTGAVLQKLREVINESPTYRSGPKLVSFFNDLGFNDVYENFPSRWVYTDTRLQQINGTPNLDKCIIKAFSPADFIGRFEVLDNAIDDFNLFLSYDGWSVVRTGKAITFKKVSEDDFVKREEAKKEAAVITSEEVFLESHFEEISLEGLNIDTFVFGVIESRVSELHKCVSAKVPLAIIFHCGSILEGVLLGLAQKSPREFNMATSAPRKDGKVKSFPEWSLANFIDVAHNLGYVREDVRKFSHSLRDFRNYIHPYEQASNGFMPSEDTAKICYQVLKAAITQIKAKIKENKNI